MAKRVFSILLLIVSFFSCVHAKTLDGKRRVVLKYNMVDGVNTLTQSMFSMNNTKYVVRYNYSIGDIRNNNVRITSSDSSIVINSLLYYYKAIRIPAGKSFVLKDRNFCVLLNSDKTGWLKEDCIVAERDRNVYVGSQIPTTAAYEIKDYIRIPDNCVLEFKGGSIDKGVIVGNQTTIKSRQKQIFGENLNICGTWNCDAVYPQWFGAKGDRKTDNTQALVKWADFPCMNKIIPPGIYNTMEVHSYGLNGSVIKGYGATLKYVRFDIYEHHVSMHNHAVLCNTPSLYLNGADFKGGDFTIYGLTIDGNKDNFIYEGHPESANGLIWAYGINVYCLENFTLIDVKVKNTFMNGVLCHGVNNFYADRCEFVHIGECTNYTPNKLNYYWEGIGCVPEVPIHSKQQSVTLPFNSARVVHSYFEDIAGSYFSANCDYFESGWNTVVNNRGYGHELSECNNKEIKIHDNTFKKINGSFLQLYSSDKANTPNLTIEVAGNDISGDGEADVRTKAVVKDYFIRMDDSYNTYKTNSKRVILVRDNKIKLNECKLINPKNADVLIENNEITFCGKNTGEVINIRKNAEGVHPEPSNITVRNNIFNLGSYSLFINNAPASDIIIEDNTIRTDYSGDGTHEYSPYCIRTGDTYKSLELNRNEVRGFNVFLMAISADYGGVVAKNNDIDTKWFVYTVFPQLFPPDKPLKAVLKGNKIRGDGEIKNTFNIEYSKDSDILKQ